MDKLLELDEISLLPSVKNSGYHKEKNYGVIDQTDNTISLPIFTSPMNSVVDESNWKTWSDNGIRPILPRTSDLQIRLEGCQYIFSAFSLKEVKDCFLVAKRTSTNLFHVCIETGNGQDEEIFKVGSSLKKIYGNQIVLMGSNLGNPNTYVEYCKSGFDFVRIGMTNGSLVSNGKYGFYYPMASLIIDTAKVKATSTMGLPKQTKIIADGGIDSPANILKALAIGADYVMLGRELAKLVEAAGELSIKETDRNGRSIIKPIKVETVLKLSSAEMAETELKRSYAGQTTDKIRPKIVKDYDDWVGIANYYDPSDSNSEVLEVKKTIKEWQAELFDCFNYGFTLAGAVDWKGFKTNINYIKTFSI